MPIITTYSASRGFLIFMLISLPIIIIIRALMCKKLNRFDLKREVLIIFFASFCVGLASQTLIPPEFLSGDFSHNPYHMPTKAQIYINPLGLFHWLYLLYVFKNFDAFVLNYIGNILIFMPFGFLIPYLWKKPLWFTVLIGFLTSTFIEVCQLFYDRTTDISDVILNVTGTLLGYLTLRIAKKLYLRIKRSK